MCASAPGSVRGRRVRHTPLGGYAKTQKEKKQQFSIMEDNLYELFPHLKNRDSLYFI